MGDGLSQAQIERYLVRWQEFLESYRYRTHVKGNVLMPKGDRSRRGQEKMVTMITITMCRFVTIGGYL